MMEGIQQSVEEKRVSTPEVGLETQKHLDVAEQMKEKNAFFVHMIQVTKQLDVSENNQSGLDTNKMTIADKLDLLYAVNPTVSASSLRPKTQDGTFYGGFGVIFSHGQIEAAAQGDMGTKATSLTERNIGEVYSNPDPEAITNVIEREHTGDATSYNEIVLKNPEVAGGFLKLEPFKQLLKYEEEEQEYYDGQKITTKVGVVDFSNPVDRFGKPTGQKFDVPFSVLKEMSERGKTFFMDEENQMYIIRSIDEKTRQVEFIAAPIDPKTFAESYGDERINKYTKMEMRDRLKKSLSEKGMML